jgi:hypothetical protein
MFHLDQTRTSKLKENEMNTKRSVFFARLVLTLIMIALLIAGSSTAQAQSVRQAPDLKVVQLGGLLAPAQDAPNSCQLQADAIAVCNAQFNLAICGGDPDCEYAVTASRNICIADAIATYPCAPTAFSGFFQPVDNLPTLNSVNAGQAIPVKFSLGSDQGLGIFEVGYPKSEQIVCNSGALVDGIETTVNAGSSSLSYSAGNDQYTYVWKTEKSWTGCRQLVVKLLDGTIQRANFQFK